MLLYALLSFRKQQPYSGSTADLFDPSSSKGSFYRALIDHMNNATQVLFAIHLGDIKSVFKDCTDLHYGRYEQMANALAYPNLLALGDNEWADCHVSSSGGFDPLDRLAVLRNRFYSVDGMSVQGGGTPIQTLNGGAEYPENQFIQLGDVSIAVAKALQSALRDPVKHPDLALINIAEL